MNWETLTWSPMDRYIYEKRGYKAVNVNAAPDGIKVKTMNSWVVVPPEVVGNWHLVRSNLNIEIGALNANEAWDKFVKANPIWGNDANALALFMSLPEEYTPRLVRVMRPPVGWQWKAAILAHDDMLEVSEQYSEFASRAICRAWCKWQASVSFSRFARDK